MLKMHVLGLSVDSTAKTPILLLQEEGEKRVLPIWIGSMEAMSISMALSGQSVPRPLTHDLLLDAITFLGAEIKSLEIEAFKGGIFYASLVMRHGERVMRVDCRPSDGITLAIKKSFPIFIEPEVLEASMHAQQQQDATSFQLLKPHEQIEQKRVEAPSKTQKNVHHITIKMPPKSHVKTVADDTPVREKDFEKLLRSLEPPSTKKM